MGDGHGRVLAVAAAQEKKSQFAHDYTPADNDGIRSGR